MAADWSQLAARLRGSADVVTLSWRELDDLVGGMPRSAIDHPAWWGGDRSHTRAWRSAGFEVASKRPGVSVTFRRRSSSGGPAADNRTAVGSTAESRTQLASQSDHVEDTDAPDILLVTCVKAKASTPRAARDLYVSSLFVKERAYAERLDVPWFILSAEHGLVAPDEWLAPYERYLPDTPKSYQQVWGRWVVARLALLMGSLSGRVIEVHASDDYVAAIEGPLREHGAVVLEPLRGLRMGERLAWYNEEATRGISRMRDDVGELAPADDIHALVAKLRDERSAMTPEELRTRGSEGLIVPGLYSWWVDAEGAADLTDGLGHRVDQGLIYAGLAGATRWPSGARSTNTLWARLTGMHLGSRHKFSTFRLTLGSILATARDWDDIDEAELTRWIFSHLRVVPVPFPDADALGRIEVQVLAAIDPPLNLKDVPRTALRAQLTELRRRFADD